MSRFRHTGPWQCHHWMPLYAMNSRQQKILAAIFSNPTPKTMVWADIEALLPTIGCVVHESDLFGMI